MNFLDSDSSEGEGGGSKGDDPKLRNRREGERLRVNEKFAKSFEKKKREQELQAAKHIDLRDGEDGLESDSESETEDEEAEMLTPALDLQIMRTINRIRTKDPDIYDSKKEWFVEQDEGGPSESKKPEKPMRYKDVVREQIMQAHTAEDAISSDDDSDNDDRGTSRRGGFAYDEEQERLRKSLLGSIAEHEGGSGGDSDGDSDGDGLLKVRKKTAAEVAEEEEELRREAEKMKSAGDGGEEDEFLRDFVANRRWLDPSSKETPSYEEILDAPHVEDSEDEKEIDRADQFESKYNFRFEEEGGTEIAMHSRNVPGSMRRKDDKRKRERESRKARKAEERAQKEAELRRLKNIKRAEVRRRLEAIQEMSGGALVDEGLGEGANEIAQEGGGQGRAGGVGAEDLVDGDFDPDKWDAVTGQAFGDEYYEAQDADDGWKPGDDPLEGLGDLDQYNNPDDADDFEENDDDAAANGRRSAKPGRGAGGPIGEEEEGVNEEEEGGDWEAGDEEEWEGEEGEEEGFEGVGAEKERLLDELYKLDYEDIVGDIPCRFKYTTVKPNDFGLAPEEILLADDKDLNKYVPLKKLAPYRAEDPTLDARRRRHLRDEVKAREAAAEAEVAALKASRKKRRGKKKTASISADSISGDGTTGNGSTSTITPAVTEELAGGKRRRRKKGQKKKRAKGEAGGGTVGEKEADMVPRVVPMMLPVENDDNEQEGPDSADVENPTSNKKGSKKRRRNSQGDGGQIKVELEDDVAGAEITFQAGRSEGSAGVASGGGELNGASAGTGDKKTRRRTRGKGGNGKDDRDNGKRAKPKPKQGGRGGAQLAAVTGVSKSRLASYGL